jgi:hypothetical protein
VHDTLRDRVLSRNLQGEYSPLGFATVQEILVTVMPDGSQEWSSTFMMVQPFVLASTLHPILSLPMVERSPESIVLRGLVCIVLYTMQYSTPDCLHSQDLIAAVNLQHNCERGKCKSDGKEVIREE